MMNFIRKHKLLVATIIISGGVAAGFVPLRNYAAHRAEALVRQGDQSSDIAVRISDYKVASMLKRGDSTIILKLAQAQFEAGQHDESLKTLGKHNSSEALKLKARNLMEQSKVKEATDAAKDAGDYELFTLYQDLQTGTIDPVIIAQRLYGQKLVRSTQRLLTSQSNLTFEGNLLLGKANITLKSFSEAKKALEVAVNQAPANIEAHQLLKSVYNSLNDKQKADEEMQRIQQLEQGSV